MYTVGSSYWNLGVGHDLGEVEQDREGIATMENLGRNMAWILKKDTRFITCRVETGLRRSGR